MNAKHRRLTHSFAALAVVMAAFTLVSTGQATTVVNVVWPPFCEDVECNDVISPLSTPYPGTIPTSAVGYRTQFLIPSSVFDSLGPGPFEIIAFAWRPDQSVYEPVTVVWEETTWNLSTTPIVGLSLRFADNYGPGGIEQVFSEPVTYYTDGVPRGVGLPHEFDYRFEFETPYLYDPQEGNLLAEMTTPMAFDETHYFWADFHRNNASSLTVFGSPEDDEEGFRVPGEPVLQLTVRIIPEPSTLLLCWFAIGFVVVVRFGRRKSRGRE